MPSGKKKLKSRPPPRKPTTDDSRQKPTEKNPTTHKQQKGRRQIGISVKKWYNISHNLSLEELKMWNFPKFMRNFPMPSECTKEQLKLIERYSRLWHKHFKESIRIQNETEFIHHCYDNAFFDSWE